MIGLPGLGFEQLKKKGPTYLYGPLITWALSEWSDETIYLSFDPTMLWNRFCVMRLSLVYRGRAIPVIWRVLEHGSSSLKLVVYQDLLKKAARFMPAGKKVVFLADRGFGDHQLMDDVRYTLQWEFRIRLKPKCLFHAPGLGWKQFKNDALKPGEALLFQQIRFFKRHSVERVNVVFAREATSGELWLIVSSEPVSLQTLQEYGLRFDIEENFLDDKSNGFDWKKSRLRDPLALFRLYLVRRGDDAVFDPIGHCYCRNRTSSMGGCSHQSRHELPENWLAMGDLLCPQRLGFIDTCNAQNQSRP